MVQFCRRQNVCMFITLATTKMKLTPADLHQNDWYEKGLIVQMHQTSVIAQIIHVFNVLLAEFPLLSHDIMFIHISLCECNTR